MNCKRARVWIHGELDGDLSPGRRTALADHLARCDACREVHRQFSMMRVGLTRLAAATDEPEGGAGGGRIELPARRGVPWRTGLAVAATIALCVTVWRAVDWEPSARLQPTMIAETGPQPSVSEPAPEVVDPRSQVEVTFDPNADLLTMPIETGNPNVTIIWVYPTIRTARATEDSTKESKSSRL